MCKFSKIYFLNFTKYFKINVFPTHIQNRFNCVCRIKEVFEKEKKLKMENNEIIFDYKIVKCEAIGIRFISGIASCYDDTYPSELQGYISGKINLFIFNFNLSCILLTRTLLITIIILN